MVSVVVKKTVYICDFFFSLPDRCVLLCRMFSFNRYGIFPSSQKFWDSLPYTRAWLTPTYPSSLSLNVTFPQRPFLILQPKIRAPAFFCIRKIPHLTSVDKSMVVKWVGRVCRAGQTPLWKAFSEQGQHLRPFSPSNCFCWPQVNGATFSFLQPLSSHRKILILRGWSQPTAVSRAELSRLLHKQPHSAWLALLPP